MEAVKQYFKQEGSSEKHAGTKNSGDMHDIKIGFFDVQTTGLVAADTQVLQISCVIGEENFSVYVKTMPEKVSELNGLTLMLHYKGVQVETVPEETAWKDLLEFISKNGPVLLVGHNIIEFDAVFMVKYFRKYNLLEKSLVHIIALTDTLKLFRKLHPNLGSYALKKLVQTFGITPFEPYNAPSHNAGLKELLVKANISDYIILNNKENFSNVIEDLLKTYSWF